MPETTVSEWLLACCVGRDRATAILGDLLELSATRGPLWFWAAYTRTLVSVGWRTPAAFLFACGFSDWFTVHGFATIHTVLLLFHRSRHYIPPTGIWKVAAPKTFWLVPLGDSIVALWFVLSFIVARYGLRDRIVRLAAALVLLTLPYFGFYPAGTYFAIFASAAMMLTALCLRRWRRQMIVLIASVTPIALAILLSPQLWYRFLSKGYGFASPQLECATALYRATELCAAAIVCSSLYSQLLATKSTDRTRSV